MQEVLGRSLEQINQLQLRQHTKNVSRAEKNVTMERYIVFCQEQ